MAQFSYIGLDKTGKYIKGKMNATNVLDLQERMRELGAELVDYKIEGARKKKVIGGKISPKDLIMFCVHMEELERAGVPIIDAMIDLRDTVDNPKMRDILTDLCEYIKGGDLLSAALRRRQDVFDELFCGLVATGEETGNIGDSFGHLSRHIKWNTDFKRKIKKAMSYPIFLIFVMVLVITAMMIGVVPKLVDFLQKQGFELPFYTTALIATSAFFVQYWYVLIGGLVGSFISIIAVYKFHEPTRYKMDLLLLKVPGVGPVILKINLARFVKFFAITFNSGLGVLEALNTSQKVVTNRVLKESVGVAYDSISEGKRLTDAIADTKRFPSLVVRMFKVGEDSGNMDRSLANVNFFYEREIDDAVSAMIAMIQPTLLVFMGGLMFWIIIAVFGPIYGSFSQMNF
jgi:type IV pilus assembly protein PilC